jgi:hypothetical protein
MQRHSFQSNMSQLISTTLQKMTTPKIRCNSIMHYSQPYTKSLEYDETIATKMFNIATKKSIALLQNCRNTSQFGSNNTYLLHRNAITLQHIILVAIIDTYCNHYSKLMQYPYLLHPIPRRCKDLGSNRVKI